MPYFSGEEKAKECEEKATFDEENILLQKPTKFLSV